MGVEVWQALRNLKKAVSVIIEPLVIVNPFLNVGSGSLDPNPHPDHTPDPRNLMT
jgi:hypothetical protein